MKVIQVNREEELIYRMDGEKQTYKEKEEEKQKDSYEEKKDDVNTDIIPMPKLDEYVKPKKKTKIKTKVEEVKSGSGE